MKYPINENEMPLNELEKLGLYKDGGFSISPENIDALLAGRRTDMLSMAGLNIDGLAIRQLDAKLSLSRNELGDIQLNIHPIYREPQWHPLLSDDEEKALIAGEQHVVSKEQDIDGNKKKKVIIEYDDLTREFIAYEPEEVQAPIRVNGEELSEKQQEAFRNGEVVELTDGTKIQHSATDNKGIRSDRKRLILSVLLDGGISYLVFRGINNLKGRFEPQSEGYSEGYNRALADIMMADKKQEDRGNEKTVQDLMLNLSDKQESRSYGRGVAR
ncbi:MULTISPECIES: DUF4099 domain-containing protein [Sphingobacterium]|uniref:Uncharacterized protein DUF3945 n=1 Tax=Sphingobacterium siyangense TaxID=459529 RepID=A0A562M6S4_9SPHI|nr:DUF4099 domain-containing protein [Sphingobacterium siyangense]TWI15498.1 uncharacterized protein DUF3945 [Sphingobacterium siyangense]